MKDFPWFPGVRYKPYTQKRKLGNHGNSSKTQNAEMWVCKFKNPWNAVQITSNSQRFSNISNHAAANWVL